MIGIWNALAALARTMLERKVEYRKKNKQQNAGQIIANYINLNEESCVVCDCVHMHRQIMKPCTDGSIRRQGSVYLWEEWEGMWEQGCGRNDFRSLCDTSFLFLKKRVEANMSKY